MHGAQVSYDGQQHSTRMARVAPHGAASWSSEPPLLLAALRPLGGPAPLELELWGSKDTKWGPGGGCHRTPVISCLQ